MSSLYIYWVLAIHIILAYVLADQIHDTHF